MLGRTADQLYWIARYTDRAENMARLLDVSHRMSITLPPGPAQLSAWASALEVSGDDGEYEERYGEVSSGGVIRHLAFDEDHTSSIVSCLRAARENARALRATITTEMWESLNTTWLDLQNNAVRTGAGAPYVDFFDWVKERALLFRGVTQSTMLQDDSHAFMTLGWAIERSDNTARLLDSKYHVLLPGDEDVGGSVDYYQWGAVLRSVGAFRAYHKIYADVITPLRVAELLMLRRDLPRSLVACLERITTTLDTLCHDRARECQRLAGVAHARLRFSRMDEIFEIGLHEFLTTFIDRNTELAGQIQRDFMMVQ
jgi:uncharacterized alpha-E superfamily protein